MPVLKYPPTAEEQLLLQSQGSFGGNGPGRFQSRDARGQMGMAGFAGRGRGGNSAAGDGSGRDGDGSGGRLWRQPQQQSSATQPDVRVAGAVPRGADGGSGASGGSNQSGWYYRDPEVSVLRRAQLARPT
eukprot:SAG31_NODE_9835_length_1222_cov_0.817453_1_plen_130_part_00